MQTPNDPRNLLVEIAKTLDSLKIPYIVTGGIAVLIWGRPRFTADIDIVIEMQEKDVDIFQKAILRLRNAGYLDADSIREAIGNFGEFNFIDGETGLKVDFWILKKNDPFDLSRIRRKKTKKILGHDVHFTSPEDLILMKLKWMENSLSSKQAEDIESIIKISGDLLNWPYIKKMAKKIGVAKLIKKIKIDY